MKAILTTSHSDEVSGCTFMDNGDRVFWTEGRDSDVLIWRADGTPWWISASEVMSNPAARDEFEKYVDECGGGHSRPMTPMEELEIDIMRGPTVYYNPDMTVKTPTQYIYEMSQQLKEDR